MNVDDRQLLAKIRMGDEQAFDVLFRHFYGSLVGFGESLLRGRGMAEDVAQEVLLEVWRRRESLEIDDSWRSYLFRSVRNRAFNELRRERVVQRAEPLLMRDEAVGAPAHGVMVAAELDTAFRATVSAMAEPVREVFEMSRRDGLKYSEIAAALGVSVKTVEARMGRALKMLREELAEWLPGGE